MLKRKYYYEAEENEYFSSEIGTYRSYGIVCLWLVDGYPRVSRVRDVTMNREEAIALAGQLTQQGVPADQMLQAITRFLDHDPAV